MKRSLGDGTLTRGMGSYYSERGRAYNKKSEGTGGKK